MGRKKNTRRSPNNWSFQHRNGVVAKADRQPADFTACEPARQNRYLLLAICGFLLLAVGLVFGQTVRYQFVNFDDDKYVYDNPQVSRGLTAEGGLWAFAQSHCVNWHPLTWISLMLDCQIYGLCPGGCHLTNQLLHAATAILLFLVLQRMTGHPWLSALATALFAVHPLRVESVAWITERKDVLSGLFFALTLGAYVSYVRHRFSLARYLLVMVFFAAGLLSKPMLITAPLLLLLLDYWPLGRMVASTAHEAGPVAKCSRLSGFSLLACLALEKVPLLLLAAVSSVMTVRAQAEALAPIARLPLGWRIEISLVSYVAYLGQFFYPVGLAILYPRPGLVLPLWQSLGAFLVLTGITAAVLFWRRRCPYLFVGWFWYLGMLAPVIGLVQIGAATMADRYTYLPQIGLAIAVVWAVGAQCRSSERRRWVCMVASVFLLAILMGGAWRQTCFWRNGATVWTHALACTSRNSVAHNGLGAILLRQRRIDEAIAQFQRAVDIAPGYFLARANLGAALLLRGRVDEAITQYRKALELDPGDAESHTSLAMALAGRGQFNEAVAHYQKALEINPNVVEPHNNMAWLQATCPVTELRSGDKAIEHAQRANRLCRGRRADALDTLAAAYAERGQFPEALATVRKALDLATQQHDQRLADTLRSRTKLYAAGKPYRPTRLQSVCLPAK